MLVLSQYSEMETNIVAVSPPFAYHYVLLGLTLYYVVEGVLKITCRRFLPDLYKKLKSDYLVLPFFGFAMGWLITLISSPICLYAFVTENSETSLKPSLSGQICVASRSILWVSELNRLDYISVFVKHHLGSLAHLTSHMYYHVPLTPLYLIYASLVTELLSTAASICSILGYKPTTSLHLKRIQQANTIAVPLLRTPPVFYTAYTVIPLLTGLPHALSIFFLAGYAWSFLRTKPRDFKRLGMIPDLSKWRNKIGRLSLFGIFASVAYLMLIISVSTKTTTSN